MEETQVNLPEIIFDFDGTIADSLSLLVNSINNIANDYGYKNIDISESKIRQTSIKDLIKTYKVSLFKLPFLVNATYQSMAKNSDLIKPFCGIVDAVKELKQNNFKLSIISSNNKENIQNFLKKHALNNIFDNIYTGSSIFGKHKIINKFLNKYNLKQEDTIYIGDEIRDIVAAKKSGIKIIAVSWGFNEPSILEKHSPDFIAFYPSEILKFLKTYLNTEQF